MFIIFQPESGDPIETATKQVFANAPSGQETATAASFKLSTEKLTAGKYTVYLKVSDPDGTYPVQFANNLWNEELKANKIGEIEIGK